MGMGLPEDTFAVEKLLTWSSPEISQESYWLAPEQSLGNFSLELGETSATVVSNIFIVNTHNGDVRDRGTRKFQVL